MRAAKFVTAVIGGALTAAQSVLTPDTIAWNFCTVGLATLTAISVYLVRNEA